MPKTKSITPAQSFAAAISINDLNYVLLKRKNDKEIPALHPRDRFTIFAMLDKFLGGDGLASEKSEFWEEYGEAISITDDQKFAEMLASMQQMPEDRRQKWTIIVFSETFFSDEPYDDEEIEKFLKLCRLLTIKYPKTVISVNFLHKYQGKSSTFSRNTPKGKNYVVSNDAARLKQNKSSDLRFSNSSLIFWSGVSLSCYQKTSYKDEADDLVAAGYGYDFGDFKSYAPPELSAASDDHKKFAELFNSGQLQIISARTCYDMNLTPKLSRQIKLLILTADGSPYFEGWSEKTSNAAVCVCDADRGTFFLIHNSIFETTHIEVVPFISNELSCILTVYYGGIFDEDVNSFSGNCC